MIPQLITAYEARVLKNLFLLLLAPQVGERVDDDNKNQVQNDNDDDEEEEHVVNHSSTKPRKQSILYTNSIQSTINKQTKNTPKKYNRFAKNNNKNQSINRQQVTRQTRGLVILTDILLFRFDDF